ncbi:MAG: hypothetical protein ACXWQO_07260 [Bdellovibrionota bacterium]
MPKITISVAALLFSFLVYSSFAIAEEEALEKIRITGTGSETSSSSFSWGFGGTSSEKSERFGLDNNGSKRISIHTDNGVTKVLILTRSEKEVPQPHAPAGIVKALQAAGSGCALTLYVNKANRLVKFDSICKSSELEQHEEESAVDAG